MKTLTEITEILDSTDDSTVIELWNDYQDAISGEQRVYEFDDQFFEDYFSNPYDAARATYFGSIENWTNPYITFNGYGNLESLSNPIDMISLYDLANYINDNQDNFSTLLED